MQIASYIDHTLLKPGASMQEVETICREAIEYGFAAVCIPPFFVKRAASLLKGTGVKVATVAGFPFGYSVAQAKLFEVQQAIADGADELDVVINLTALKNSYWNVLEEEMIALTRETHKYQRIIKVIIESGALSDDEIIRCCEMYANAGADFLKTSTGYAEKGATIEAVQLMRKHLPSGIKIKASGGIRSYAFAKQLVEAGADRLGSSAGTTIVTQQSLNNE